ncbi:hypothetical protein BOX15_Mlig011542g1 [Macrostomum lignano]|uniref:Uncharacterized protein n=1 Tax=Macrostomum lignano TaxID=282301 RepID=A0A267EDM1_9PLAT|nr:hypothetical protein BOX15_Mlig011542g1 [Macrostomum lignano]
MAACSSEIDSTVFLRWRQPSPASAAETERRRQQLREDFRRKFGAIEQTQPAVAQPKQQSPSKVVRPGQIKSDTKASRVQPVRVKSLPRQDCQAAAGVSVSPKSAAQAPVSVPSQLRYIRLLSPDTRANRWMHTTWHHLPPNPDTSRGNCRASHFSTALSSGSDCGHFRIHPDWGWDAPPSQTAGEPDCAKH